MKKYSILLSILLPFLVSCQHQKSITTTGQAQTGNTSSKQSMSPTVNSSDEKVYFKGSGTEPFWSIEISEDVVRFRSLVEGYETFNIPHTEPVRAADANVKMYQAETELGTMKVQIQQVECINAMSGAASDYTVTVELKRATEQDFTVFEGCGQYIADYRLHDIWVLEELNGTKVTEAQFQQELPLMEINASETSFTGFAGCNRMRGRLFSEKDILRFTNIVTTKMMCPPENREAEFLTALRSSTTFRIENNRLYLSNPDGLRLVFKKID